MLSFLGHTDTLLNLYQDKEYDFMRLNEKFHIDLPRLQKAQVGVQVFAVYVESEYKPGRALERTIQIIDQFYNIISRTDQLVLINDVNEINDIIEQGKIAAILAIEGAEAVFDLTALRMLYRLGVRLLSLTWNQRNHLAEGVGELDANGGVTCLGKKVIKEMNRLGMLIDVSHLSPASFWDVIKYSEKPVIASHSNSYEVCPHPRNLTDEQLKALAERGGHIGINFAPAFLKEKGKAEIKDVIRHIDYIRDLIGLKHITLGTDFDGIFNVPVGLEDVTKLNSLSKSLEKHGYSKQEIKRIFWDNWIEFLRKN